MAIRVDRRIVNLTLISEIYHFACGHFAENQAVIECGNVPVLYETFRPYHFHGTAACGNLGNFHSL
jgi:hypothetical protein